VITRLEQRGPHNPVEGTVGRAPGSIRRTTTIDTRRPDGLDGLASMIGVARDLWTDPGGIAIETARRGLMATVHPPTRELLSLTCAPARPSADAVIGVSVASGFRGKLLATDPALATEEPLLFALLDDLPGAALVSGYAFLRADRVSDEHRGRWEAAVDICAGWAEGTTMVSAIRTTGRNPVPMGPPAPPVVDPGDAVGWHPMVDPGPHGTRRMRRIDLSPSRADGHHDVDAFFRDSHWDDDERQTVIHEYTVRAVVDPDAGKVVEISAAPDVLPWMECPAAIDSAQRLNGRTFTDLRQWVRAELIGTTTCTHLNDTLRSLGDLESLLGQLLALRS
jgi:hypothetical protein